MSKKKILKRIILALIAVCLATGLGVFVLNFIVIGSTRSQVISVDEAAKLEDVDCIIVLGCGVYADGSLSPMLNDRLDVASEVYSKGTSDKLLMSGDHGTMYYESIFRAKAIFGAKKIVIVTNTYHLYRALYIADRLGIEAYGVGADDIYSGKSYRAGREILARDKDFVKCIYKPDPSFLGDEIDIHGDGDVTND